MPEPEENRNSDTVFDSRIQALDRAKNVQNLMEQGVEMQKKQMEDQGL
jgi:hypothetical protein